MSSQVVYVVRNPKDMAVSLYHFYKMQTARPFDFRMESYFKSILNNKG